MSQLVNIDDFRRLASRRLPRFLFEYLDGGALDEVTQRSNVTDLARLRLRQRVMSDVSSVDLRTTVLGQTIDTPVLISPMGLLSVFHRDADIATAKAARQAGTVFVQSAWSSTRLKDVAAAAPGAVWCQANLFWPDRGLLEEHLRRAEDAGISVLVLAGDVAVADKRERDLRNGYGYEGRLSLRGVLDAARKPRWLVSFMRGSKTAFGIQSDDGHPMNRHEVGVLTKTGRRDVTWDEVARIRERWSGKLAVKGIMTPEDAELAVEVGVDAVFVSNHGGRQFDAQPSTVSVLPGIVNALNGRAEILVDGGIRRGGDIVKMHALGATACLIGRPAVYGLASAGQAGVGAVLDVLREEAGTALAFTGNVSLDQLDSTVLAFEFRDLGALARTGASLPVG
jgi:L-lactate dehydrogenase (cytochrome)